MIIEIFYRGVLIAESEVPNHMNMSDVEFAFRLESKMDTAQVFEIDFEKVAAHAAGRIDEPKKVTNNPRKHIAEKEVVKFERPKAEYSNHSPMYIANAGM
jgi:hypothetical protein